ncbi:hypothetical protein EV363DRAFT_1353037, partial [Boletus edulis]
MLTTCPSLRSFLLLSGPMMVHGSSSVRRWEGACGACVTHESVCAARSPVPGSSRSVPSVPFVSRPFSLFPHCPQAQAREHHARPMSSFHSFCSPSPLFVHCIVPLPK